MKKIKISVRNNFEEEGTGYLNFLIKYFKLTN